MERLMANLTLENTKLKTEALRQKDKMTSLITFASRISTGNVELEKRVGDMERMGGGSHQTPQNLGTL